MDEDKLKLIGGMVCTACVLALVFYFVPKMVDYLFIENPESRRVIQDFGERHGMEDQWLDKSAEIYKMKGRRRELLKSVKDDWIGFLNYCEDREIIHRLQKDQFVDLDPHLIVVYLPHEAWEAIPEYLRQRH